MIEYYLQITESLKREVIQLRGRKNKVRVCFFLSLSCLFLDFRELPSYIRFSSEGTDTPLFL